MDLRPILEKIRPMWLASISEYLASEQGVRKSFREELDGFYNCILDAAADANLSPLERQVDDWLKSQTETEVDRLDSTLLTLVNSILVHSLRVFRENLDADEALAVIEAVMPAFAHLILYISLAETSLRIQHFTDELESARATLERLEKSKSDFISVAAHELKTPLTLVDGYASMLPESLPISASDAQVNILLDGIRAGTKRLREIVDDMIDVSLIDNNLLALNFQPVWLDRLFGLVQRELGKVLKDRNLNIVFNPFPGSGEMIFADGERLLQAFRNIITNAVKYTPDGGTITVDGRLLPGFIEMVVADTGIGINPEDHVHIFEKFGRLGDVTLHSSGKTKFMGGGPGLGLPITKGVIEAHGGTIWVESAGRDEIRCPGTTFHVLLPVRKSPPDEKIAKLFHSLLENR